MQQAEEVVDPTELTITYDMRHLMDQNLLGTPEFAHITRLIIDGICPSLIDGPYGLHNRIQFPPNLKYLKYTNSHIDNVPPNLPDTLEELDISGNRISRLTGLPPNLRILNCMNNQLNALSGIPDSVTEIYCHYNPLTLVNSTTQLPAQLTIFAACYCELTELPALPITLTRFACTGNTKLNKLPPVLPQGLVDLVCSECSLDELPALPDTLTTLWCNNNNIYDLGHQLPASLKDLQCEVNQLTKLPALPIGLTYLACGDNLLTSLPDLPPRLELLSCNKNQLFWIPELPNTLTHLNCSNNKLIAFSSAMPCTLGWLDCSGNAELKWMPPVGPNVLCMRLSTINIQRTYGYSDRFDVVITDEIAQDINKTHWSMLRKMATEALAVYKSELLERQMEITLNPDRIARLIRNGELGELGTWTESLGF